MKNKLEKIFSVPNLSEIKREKLINEDKPKNMDDKKNKLAALLRGPMKPRRPSSQNTNQINQNSDLPPLPPGITIKEKIGTRCQDISLEIKNKNLDEWDEKNIAKYFNKCCKKKKTKRADLYNFDNSCKENIGKEGDYILPKSDTDFSKLNIKKTKGEKGEKDSLIKSKSKNKYFLW